MARSDWTALVTDPTAEYVVNTELLRFGLTPYLPQIRRRWTHPYTRKSVMRHFPLFPRYILIPIKDIDFSAFRMCRGLCRNSPVLASRDGRPWRAPGYTIEAIRTAESNGIFDETLFKGDKVAINQGILQGIQACVEKSSINTVEMFTPLLGGTRATINPDKLTRV